MILGFGAGTKFNPPLTLSQNLTSLTEISFRILANCRFDHWSMLLALAGVDVSPYTTEDFSMMERDLPKYRMVCTLSFGDIYGQIIVWLIVIFLSLASALALASSTRPVYALATVGLVLVLSLPFLLFSFVTTLFNHLDFVPVESD